MYGLDDDKVEPPVSGLNEAEEDNEILADPLGILGNLERPPPKVGFEIGHESAGTESSDSESSDHRRWATSREGRDKEARRREKAQRLANRFGPKLSPTFRFGQTFQGPAA